MSFIAAKVVAIIQFLMTDDQKKIKRNDKQAAKHTTQTKKDYETAPFET